MSDPTTTTYEGSCHCGAVKFSLQSHTPYPYMRCYCSICRKTGGGGGYGPASDRHPAAVRADLREGYVTEPHARSHYPQAFGD